ncbi:MAG TPA: acetylxylan esterase [Firmicutes bacterium]|nr:acetylxylan esterase [Bacillota bacterium]
MNKQPLHKDYPQPAEVDNWCAELLAEAEALEFTAQPVDFVPNPTVDTRHDANLCRYIEFSSPSQAYTNFFAIFQSAPAKGPAPLLIHLPGYGTEMTRHPTLTAQGFHVLHVNPQGYTTPQGKNLALQRHGTWPVLPDTILTQGKTGYRDWLRDALVAVRWARSLPTVQADRFAFFGTSQGGGTALLLASIMRDQGVCAVAGDVPFLTNFPLMCAKQPVGAYNLAYTALAKVAAENPDLLPASWRALGFVDTLSHSHRLTMPVLLTAGSIDIACPTATVRSLFDVLPGTRSYTELYQQGHAYTTAFLHLAAAWFRLYV